MIGWKYGRGKEEGRCFFFGQAKGAPKRPERPRRAYGSALDQTFKGKKEHGYFGGMKTLERRQEAARFSEEAQERRGVRETVFRSSGWRKALEGGPQECWELKDTS